MVRIIVHNRLLAVCFGRQHCLQVSIYVLSYHCAATSLDPQCVCHHCCWALCCDYNKDHPDNIVPFNDSQGAQRQWSHQRVGVWNGCRNSFLLDSSCHCNSKYSVRSNPPRLPAAQPAMSVLFILQWRRSITPATIGPQMLLQFLRAAWSCMV